METSLFYFSQSFCAVTSNITFSLAIKKRFPEWFLIFAAWLSHLLGRLFSCLQENHCHSGSSHQMWLYQDKTPLLSCMSSSRELDLNFENKSRYKKENLLWHSFFIPPGNKNFDCSCICSWAPALEELHILKDSSISLPCQSDQLIMPFREAGWKQQLLHGKPKAWRSPTKWRFTWITNKTWY